MHSILERLYQKCAWKHYIGVDLIINTICVLVCSDVPRLLCISKHVLYMTRNILAELCPDDSIGIDRSVSETVFAASGVNVLNTALSKGKW